jgi:uncharacterized membrane protein
MDLIQIPQVIAGYTLILFIPGYALTWALYPSHDILPLIERMALSFLLSIVSVMLSVLFSDVYLGIDINAPKIVIIVTIITALASFFWLIQVIYGRSRLKMWVEQKRGGKFKDSVKTGDDTRSVQELWNIR